MIRSKLAAAILAVTAALFPACSGSRSLTVASKNFTEQLLIGEIVAQHLEHRLGHPVDRKLNLGGTLLTHQALVSGQIDVYPEYTGTALTEILKDSPSADARAVLERVRAGYRDRWRLEWLEPLGFNNTFAMVIPGPEARRLNIATLSQAAQAKRGWRLGAGYEFVQRHDGLKGLLQVYPLALEGSPKTMDLGLLYKALEQQQVDLVAANSTDGQLSALDVKVLDDDKKYFPPYEAALIVRQQVSEQNPGARQAMSELSGKFSDEIMRKLNYEVDGKHRSIAEVAREFLSTQRLR